MEFFEKHFKIDPSDMKSKQTSQTEPIHPLSNPRVCKSKQIHPLSNPRVCKSKQIHPLSNPLECVNQNKSTHYPIP